MIESIWFPFIGTIVFLLIVWFITNQLPKIFFKIKYPIISETFPVGIMEVGDIICIHQREYEYKGFDRTYRHKHVFTSVEDFFEICFTGEEIRKATYLKCSSGIKWAIRSYRLCDE